MHAGEAGQAQSTEPARNILRSSVVLRSMAVFFIGISISMLVLSGAQNRSARRPSINMPQRSSKAATCSAR